MTPIELRLWAERRLQMSGRVPDDEDHARSRLVHELHVQDAELAIQNEELATIRSELEETLARAREFFDASPIGYLYIDGRGRIESSNIAACAILGQSPADLTGRELSAIVAADDAQVVHRHLQYVRANHARQECTVHVDPRTGERRTLRVFSSLPPTDVGDGSICTALLDITPYARLEETARDQEARVRTMVDASPDAIFTVDHAGAIISANAAARRIFGYQSPADLLGRKIESLVPSWSRNAIRHGRHRGEHPEGAPPQAAGLRKDGASFPIEVGASIFGDGSRRCTVVVRERHQAAQATKFDASLDDAASVSHDLKNVLAAISAFAERGVRKSQTNDEMRAEFLEIKNSVAMGFSIVQRLLTLASPAQREVRNISVAATLRRIEPMLVRLLGEQIRLDAKIHSESAAILAAPGDLEQILINLTLNARDAMPAGGTLHIAMEEREIGGPKNARAQVVLTVRDTGIGMNEETRARMFEPFFSTKGTQGSGVGLSTVAATVKALGGQIEVASMPGRGTTFTLFLPRGETQSLALAAPPHAPRAPAPAERFSGVLAKAQPLPSILVVDDEAPTRQALQRLLEDTGQYRTWVAANMSEALAIAEREPIDLLLTDILVGEDRGDALARALRAHQPELPVLVVSGWPLPDGAIMHEDISNPRTRFLGKPAQIDTILEVISELLSDRAITADGS